MLAVNAKKHKRFMFPYIMMKYDISQPFKLYARRKIIAILISLVLFSSVVTVNNAYSTPVFVGPTQLDSSDPPGGSRVEVSTDKVFSIWLDQCGDIQYARSIDDGGIFTQAVLPISGDTGCFGLAGSGRVAAAGNNVYVVWVDAGLGGIFLQSSIYDGFTFNGFDITDGIFFGTAATFVNSDLPSFIIAISPNHL